MTDWSDIEPGDRVALAHPVVGNVTVACLRRTIGQPVLTIPGWNYDATIEQVREVGWRLDRIDKGFLLESVAVPSDGVHDDTQPMPRVR